jgi:hypothetical protein
LTLLALLHKVHYSEDSAMQQVTADMQRPGGFREAAHFWEPRRLWYNAMLIGVVLLWLVLTWPHFRPALNLVALGKMIVLAILANVCYCAAYGAEFFVQGLLPQRLWRRCRWAIWVLGMLLALVMENYWIADEIYPDVQQGASALVGGARTMGGTAIASNMNFPAAVAVIGFLAACGGFVLCIGAVVIFWFARKPKFARMAGLTVVAGTVVYFTLLLGFSAESRDIALAPGQEKYFCEIDCHLAYSVTGVTAKPTAGATEFYVALRTRFDETTTSPSRPKDSPLMPSRREVQLMDAGGHTYEPSSTAGISLMTPLKPGDCYTTKLEFRIPKDTRGLRLLLITTPGWPDHLVIGDENSWLHGKTYFAVEPAKPASGPSNS